MFSSTSMDLWGCKTLTHCLLYVKQVKLGGYQNTGFKREVREAFVYSLNAQSV